MPEKQLRAVIWAAVSSVAQTADDKDSLPNQVAAGRAIAAREGWDVVAVLEVPGFSRDYFDLSDCAEGMEREGITAFKDLIKLWDKRGFDVLICRSADRFARTQALHSRIVEYTVRIVGARFYVTSSGLWVDKSNYRYFTAIDGLRAASEIDELVRRRAEGMPSRVARGLPAGRTLLSHKIEYEEGKAVRLVVDESKRQLLTDLANVFLSGVSYERLGVALYELGHVNPKTGRHWSGEALFYLLHNPFFWGHSALNFQRRGHSRRIGNWVFDESVPVPPGIHIWRNTHPAAYTGELALMVQAELVRRGQIQGTYNKHALSPFSRLVYCAGCHRLMSYKKKEKWEYYYCKTQADSRRRLSTEPCELTKFIRLATVHEYVSLLLAEIYETGDISLLRTPEPESETSGLKYEIEVLNGQLASLINDKLNEKRDSVRQKYAEKIDEVGERLDILKRRLEDQEARIQQSAAREAIQVRSVEELRRQGVEHIMKWSGAELNQFLFSLLGNTRLLALNGEIVGLYQIKPKQK